MKVTRDGKPAAGEEVTAVDALGKEIAHEKSDDQGLARLCLPQYTFTNGKKADGGAYTIKCGAAEAKADGKKDAELKLEIK